MKYALTLFAVMIGGIGGVSVITSAPAQAQTYCQSSTILRVASFGRERG